MCEISKLALRKREISEKQVTDSAFGFNLYRYVKECVHSYLKNASEMGLAALTVSHEQRAALACPQCKETSGMRVAYGPQEGEDSDGEEDGGMVIDEHS
jgi:hypothetical protein